MRFPQSWMTALMVAVLLLAGQAPAQVSTNATNVTVVPALTPATVEILKLAEAGVSDETILAYLKYCGRKFQLDADQIIFLLQHGVSETVIKAMLTQSLATTAVASAATPPAPGIAPQPPPSAYQTPPAAATTVAEGSPISPPVYETATYAEPVDPAYGYYYSYAFPVCSTFGGSWWWNACNPKHGNGRSWNDCWPGFNGKNKLCGTSGKPAPNPAVATTAGYQFVSPVGDIVWRDGAGALGASSSAMRNNIGVLGATPTAMRDNIGVLGGPPNILHNGKPVVPANGAVIPPGAPVVPPNLPPAATGGSTARRVTGAVPPAAVPSQAVAANRSVPVANQRSTAVVNQPRSAVVNVQGSAPVFRTPAPVASQQRSAPVMVQPSAPVIRSSPPVIIRPSAPVVRSSAPVVRANTAVANAGLPMGMRR